MQAVQTAATPCTQTPGNNPSQWLHNWACTYHTSNTSGYVTAGHAVGHAGGAAIGLVLAVVVVLLWIAATRRKGKTATS